MIYKTKVLLSSVCRPFGEKYGDGDSVGYELLHKQITREQGIFSPRAIHTFFGMEYIAENLDAPTVVLQYPSKSEFIRELKRGYDFIGLSFIMATFHKLKESVALVRKYSPRSKIILGGYGTVLKDEIIKPYGDYFCREEGVGFFRRLLGEPEKPMPYDHPLVITPLKIFSKTVSNTGKIFGGLGCPNGCDFCCTSYFYKRRHIRLLPEGKDLFKVIERYRALDPSLVYIIFDEDFLLNKKRAHEFRECVKKNGKTPSIFVFSSIKAISQYTVEEILEMGIDGFWVGYEGTKSGYAKQMGRPVADILTEFREHGIIILASMIVGFDYQNQEVVAGELDGLIKLRPSLSQFLIYGPVPNTPFYDRIIREGKLQNIYQEDMELFYRRADGFRTMIKHPTLSAEDIEGIQDWCYKEDYQRLGPSIFRVTETRFLGYLKLKTSPNALLRSKAAHFASEVRKAYPIFLTGALFGPNKTVRGWIRDLEKSIYAELGAPSLKERVLSFLALGAALWTGLTLKLNVFQHPSLIRNVYRIPEKNLRASYLWKEISSHFSGPELSLDVDVPHSKKPVWMYFKGMMSPGKAEKIAQRIQVSLQKSKRDLILDLNDLSQEAAEGLKYFGENLAAYRSRIRLSIPYLNEASPELIAMVGVFDLHREV